MASHGKIQKLDKLYSPGKATSITLPNMNTNIIYYNKKEELSCSKLMWKHQLKRRDRLATICDTFQDRVLSAHCHEKKESQRRYISSCHQLVTEKNILHGFEYQIDPKVKLIVYSHGSDAERRPKGVIEDGPKGVIEDVSSRSATRRLFAQQYRHSCKLKLNMNRVFEKLARGSCDDTTTTWSIIKKKTSLGKSGSLAVREGIKLKKHSKQSRNLAARIAALEKQN